MRGTILVIMNWMSRRLSARGAAVLQQWRGGLHAARAIPRSARFRAMFGACHMEDLQEYFGTVGSPKPDVLGLAPRTHLMHTWPKFSELG